YCFGQMQDEEAIKILVSVLEDEKQEAMVRHEAAEALGAIGSDKTLPFLLKYKNDKILEVAETCELAIERINWFNKCLHEKEKLSQNPYKSVDPAPPALTNDVNELKNILLDENESLFERYRAMFSLRNLNTKESVEVLGTALKHGSALFKHEIAFVLGQIQNTAGIPYLIKSLEDVNENEMVSHECA
nr:nero [Cucujiformia]